MSEAVETTIYPARTIHTMNRAHPSAEAIAVRGTRILGIGSVDELSTWAERLGPYTVDESFADKVLFPGFIEAHCHVMTGGMWQFPYVGFFDRRGVDGRLWTGCKNIAAVVERLSEVEQQIDDPEETLIAWGLDPIYFDGEERLLAHHLDEVSATRPMFVYHASGHLATVNSALMAKEGITRQAATPGVARYESGEPNGEFQEPAAMRLAGDAFTTFRQTIASAEAKWNYGFEARNAGNTTVADLGTSNVADEEKLTEWRSVVNDPDFPCRVMVAGASGVAGTVDPTSLAELVLELQATESEKLRFGVIKIVIDGSIQGFTARISWPHYFNAPEGHPGNGLWLIPPDQVADLVSVYHQAGLTVHCHCNGDEAAEVFIDAVEEAHRRHPRVDTRHTVQHCQLTTPPQYRRMATMGMCANIFSNHMFYWGDQHRELTVGPERAEQMDACGTAEAAGVSFSIHCDAPVTPMGPLHVAWCAVNRLTASGRVLGEQERISVDTALRAITTEAAYQLKLDHDIGSLEAGKLADLTVLDDDPYEVDPATLKDIGVWGTVVGGRKHPAAKSNA